MKTIYLRNSICELRKFEYKGIEDLREIITEIGNGAKIGNCAKIGDGAEIGNCAKIGNGAEIGSYAKIGDVAKIGNDAKIGDGAEITKNPLYIIGSKHFICNYENDKIQIGCIVESFEWWAENYETVGERESYTPEQVKEYKSYIDFIISKYKP